MIINIFPFFDELDLLEIRLHELAGIVNRFVLVESTKTFTYRDKPLYYAENRERYRQWWPQIDHYVIDNMNPSGDCWGRERQQRNHLMYGLIGHRDTDWILFNDADEIPREVSLHNLGLQHGQVKQFSMYHCYYYLDVQNKADVGGIRKLMTLKTLRDAGGPELASKIPPTEFIDHGGWHFAYQGGAEAVARKLSSFSHSEFGTQAYTDLKRLNDRISNLGCVLDRKCDMQLIDDLPECVVRDASNYRHMLRRMA